MADPSASLTMRVIIDGEPGMLISLSTDGEYADEMIDRRFYSLPAVPPDDLHPLNFWGYLLATVGRFLLNDAPADSKREVRS